MFNKKTEKQALLFDYHTLRLTIAVVIMSLPLIVVLQSTNSLPSISAAYHTEGHDIFVGFLFIVGALLLAYNGHQHTSDRLLVRYQETIVSKVGAITAFLTALFPINRPDDPMNWETAVHFIAATILFLTTVYFCLHAFRNRALEKEDKTGSLRARLYLICGWVILICIVVIGGTQLALPNEVREQYSITLIAEYVALEAFGIAWLIASQVLPTITDADKRHNLFQAEE